MLDIYFLKLYLNPRHFPHFPGHPVNLLVYTYLNITTSHFDFFIAGKCPYMYVYEFTIFDELR